MDAKELQDWVQEHVDSIATFMDYEATVDDEEEFYDTLRYWFDNESWNDGQTFVHLGIDGTGSQFAVWIRPDAEPPHPVVFFGSEGSAGVLAASPEDFAMALAHGPGIDEYGSDYASFVEENYMLTDDEPEFIEEAEAALAEYREAVVDRLKSYGALDEITSGLEGLNEEFDEWVQSRLELD